MNDEKAVVTGHQDFNAREVEVAYGNTEGGRTAYLKCGLSTGNLEEENGLIGVTMMTFTSKYMTMIMLNHLQRMRRNTVLS